MKSAHPFIAELKRYVANQNATLGPIVMHLSELIKFGGFARAKHEEIRMKQRKLSEVTDMIHAAHVFHRCVRDGTSYGPNSNSKRLHQDNIMSLLVGDYLLAQSSVDMADLRYPRTVGLIARGLEDYTRGEFAKLQLFTDCQKRKLKPSEVCAGLGRYAELTCGSLLSNACLSAALLAGHSGNVGSNSDIGNLVYSFGFHTGSAHRLIELLYCPDTNSDADKVFMETFDVRQLDEFVCSHLDKSTELLHDLPDGEKRTSLSTMLDNMRRCLSSQ